MGIIKLDTRIDQLGHYYLKALNIWIKFIFIKKILSVLAPFPLGAFASIFYFTRIE